jgi:hypothetical protein
MNFNVTKTYLAGCQWGCDGKTPKTHYLCKINEELFRSSQQEHKNENEKNITGGYFPDCFDDSRVFLLLIEKVGMPDESSIQLSLPRIITGAKAY